MKKDWETKKLSELSKHKNAIVSGPFGSNLKVSDYKESGIPILRLQNIGKSYFIDKSIKYINEKKAEELKYHSFISGDIALAKLGIPIGKTCIIPNHFKSGIITADIVRIRPDLKRIDYKYLEYFLNTDLSVAQLTGNISGATRPRVNLSDVRNIEIPLPPLPEQKCIVAILDKAFATIAKAKVHAEQNLQNAKELFDSSLSKAVIGEITKKWREENSPKKVNGGLELKQILLQIKGTERKKSRGEGIVGNELITNLLPKEWGVTNVESLFNLIDYRGKNPPRSNNGFRLITAKNIKMGYLSDEPITFISEEVYKKWMTRGFPKLDDIFFVTEGHTMGFVALNNRSDNFALAQRTITLQPAVPFDTKFLFYFMLSPYFQKIVKLNATGAAAVGMKGSRFRSLPLPFPTIAEQKAIVKKLDALSAKTKKLKDIYQQKIMNLEELKKSILQKAFNGELT